jgi:hypothetical protein
MKKAIIGLLTASVFVMGSYIFYSSQKEYKNVIDIKIEKLQVGNEYQIEKPIQKSNSISPPLIETATIDTWAELNKIIAKTEEEINSENFSGLEELKKILGENPNYPKKIQLEQAIQNWEKEKIWSAISKKIIVFEKKLNAGNYSDLEVLQQLMNDNPTYPMKGHVEEGLKRWRQEIIWNEITKQTELMEYMCDKGIFTDLETIKAIMLKNPDYPRKKLIDPKIKLWDHEFFLQNVPL